MTRHNELLERLGADRAATYLDDEGLQADLQQAGYSADDISAARAAAQAKLAVEAENTSLNEEHIRRHLTDAQRDTRVARQGRDADTAAIKAALEARGLTNPLALAKAPLTDAEFKVTWTRRSQLTELRKRSKDAYDAVWARMTPEQIGRLR